MTWNVPGTPSPLTQRQWSFPAQGLHRRWGHTPSKRACASRINRLSPFRAPTQRFQAVSSAPTFFNPLHLQPAPAARRNNLHPRRAARSLQSSSVSQMSRGTTLRGQPPSGLKLASTPLSPSTGPVAPKRGIQSELRGANPTAIGVPPNPSLQRTPCARRYAAVSGRR